MLPNKKDNDNDNDESEEIIAPAVNRTSINLVGPGDGGTFMNTDIERLIYSILLNLPRGLTGSEINDILRRVHEIKMTDRAVVSRCKAMIAQNLLEGATSEELTRD